MRLLYRSFAFVSVAFCAANSAAIRAIDRFVVALLAIMPAQRPAFAFQGPALSMNIGGQPLDPALRQRMRHESMTARVGAPRGI